MDNQYELGSSPTSENCVQVEKNKDYLPEMREELLKYKELLKSMFPFYEQYGHFQIIWNQHDFGTYGEVAFVYKKYSLENIGFVSFLEYHCPEVWEGNKIYSKEDFLVTID